MVLSTVLPPVNSLGQGKFEAKMRLIVNELFRSQILASSSLLATITCKLELGDVDRPYLPSFAFGDVVLFCHHRPGVSSQKLAATWSGSYWAIHFQLNVYFIAAANTGVVFN